MTSSSSSSGSEHRSPVGTPRSVRLSFSDQIASIEADEIVGGWALSIGGIEQSHVDLEAPTHLVHEYLGRMAAVLETAWPRRQPLRIAHLGAGALTLARYVQVTRPGSAQVVIEIERELPDLVTSALPMPEGTDLEVVIGDAREELAAMAGRRFDAIVLDVFSGESSPAHLAATEFYREVLGHLESDGLLLVNVGDDAGQRFLAAQVRHLEDAAAAEGVAGVWTLTHVSLLETPADGNMVLLAGGALASPEVEDWRAAWLRAGPHPAAVLDPEETMRAFGR
ncbi:spermidine synthase [Brachybacterium aquaticum]|uniref:Spermidine synthase n=1 Tax=Brachybacterium aquaticum TaxID=1432564 RepID=A0A841AFJ9_9MICO|nr:fused MFS/spermidine synthase [Brachybacterium aquaticum]MBB5831838.1 spermidine synthase [Brachybacterium aquaticum]